MPVDVGNGQATGDEGRRMVRAEGSVQPGRQVNGLDIEMQSIRNVAACNTRPKRRRLQGQAGDGPLGDCYGWSQGDGMDKVGSTELASEVLFGGLKAERMT